MCTLERVSISVFQSACCSAGSAEGGANWQTPASHSNPFAALNDTKPAGQDPADPQFNAAQQAADPFEGMSPSDVTQQHAPRGNQHTPASMYPTQGQGAADTADRSTNMGQNTQSEDAKNPKHTAQASSTEPGQAPTQDYYTNKGQGAQEFPQDYGQDSQTVQGYDKSGADAAESARAVMGDYASSGKDEQQPSTGSGPGTLTSYATQAKQQAQDTASSAADYARDSAHSMEEASQGGVGSAQDRAASSKDSAGDAARNAQQTAQGTGNTAQNTAASYYQSAKDTLADYTQQGRQGAQGTAASAQEAAGNYAQQAKQGGQRAAETGQDYLQSAKDSVSDNTQQAKDAATGAAGSAGDAAGQYGQQAQGRAQEIAGAGQGKAQEYGQAAQANAGGNAQAAQETAGSYAQQAKEALTGRYPLPVEAASCHVCVRVVLVLVLVLVKSRIQPGTIGNELSSAKCLVTAY